MNRSTATLALCCCLFALPTQADPASSSRPPATEPAAKDDSARALFEQGVALLGESRFDEALARFVASYRLERQPVVLLNIGMCQKVLGDLLAAHETLSRYLDEADATAHRELIDSARQALAELEAATGTLALQVDPPEAEVLVDGESIGRASATAPLRLLPGRHDVEARAEGRTAYRQTVEVGAGEAVRLIARLLPAGEEPPVAVAPPPEAGPSGVEIGAWVGVGVAAAAGLGAVITGSLGLVARDDFVEGGATDAALRDDVVTLGFTTDALIGVAAAGAATALILFLVDAYDDETPAAPDERGAGVAASVFATPGGLAVTW